MNYTYKTNIENKGDASLATLTKLYVRNKDETTKFSQTCL